MHTLQVIQGKDIMSFKTPRLLRQITSWAQFTSDPLIIQQTFDALFFPLGEAGVQIATHVRNFLSP